MLFRLSSTCFRILWDDKLHSDSQAPCFNSQQMPLNGKVWLLPPNSFLAMFQKNVESLNLTMKTKYISADSSATFASGSLNKYF